MEERPKEERSGMVLSAVRAAVLDGSVYRGLTEAPEHMLRALGVVLVAALAFGIGVSPPVSDGGPRWLAVVVAASTTLLGWVVWSYVAFGVSALLSGAQSASVRLLQRGIGLAHAPGVMLAFTGVPNAIGLPDLVAGIYLVVTMGWILLAAIVAVRELAAAAHQDDSWVKAIIPTTIGWLVSQILLRMLVIQLLTDGG